ncbi:MAG: glycosyltransferase [Syntrophorhabdaceae bacterium]|jgi:GT2 family glycosyltransferase|nr:glycosyltransferase [Syntrophorhabdaceae bacterium]
MLVSIVVITRNRPHVISNCINSLLKQEYKQYEIIVVDSSSDEGTREAMKAFPSARYIYFDNGKNKMPESRNLGIAAARGGIIAFIDDDTICSPRWLGECVKSYASPAIGVVGGRILEPLTRDLDHSRKVPVGKINDKGEFFDNFDCETGSPVEADTLRGCNMSFRKEVFEKTGGFDPNYTGNNCREEADMITRAKKAGFKVYFSPAMVLDHLVEKREDVGREKTSPRSNYYIVKNTAYYFIKNYGLISKKGLSYLLFSDTSVRYFLRTFSLNALHMMAVGLLGKASGLFTYLKYLSGKRP